MWNYDVWKNAVAPHLDRLLALHDARPSVHSRQVDSRSRAVRLGRLSWSEAGHERWCHRSPVTEEKSRDWGFVDTEIFCPARGQLVAQREWPDLYLQVQPFHPVPGPCARRYDQALHIAINDRFFAGRQAEIHEILAPLIRRIAVATYRTETRVVSLNQFEDLVRETFIYRGSHLDPFPDPVKMAGTWSRTDGV